MGGGRKKFKQVHSIAKLMGSVLGVGGGSRKVILFINLLPRGENINTDSNCTTFKRL
jgi:hypothetical protein